MEKYFSSGLPEHPALPHIGLYNPVFDCFLITVGNEELAWDLKFLLSSRYSLYPMYLNTADNYQEIEIGNHNCQLWTATNARSINLLREFFDTPIGVCNLLTPVVEENLNIDLEVEKEWALLCLFWLTKISRFRLMQPHYTRADSNLNRFLEVSNLGYKVNLHQDEEKQILKLLYLGRDFTQVAKEIEVIGQVFNE